MATIEIIIDWTGRNYCASPKDERIACIATGKTLEEVKQNIREGLEFHFEGMALNGDPIPAEFRSGWTAEYTLTARARLKYSDRYITLKALSDQTGINQQQLSHYVNGWKEPRPATQKRILDGLRAIVANLSMVL
jgi:predicted RNase H-like HicB family nuclease